MHRHRHVTARASANFAIAHTIRTSPARIIITRRRRWRWRRRFYTSVRRWWHAARRRGRRWHHTTRWRWRRRRQHAAASIISSWRRRRKSTGFSNSDAVSVIFHAPVSRASVNRAGAGLFDYDYIAIRLHRLLHVSSRRYFKALLQFSSIVTCKAVDAL